MNTLSVHLIPERHGGHTWVKVFAGKDARHRGKCGDLCFRNEEWDLLSGFMADVLGRLDPLNDVQVVVDPIEEP